MPKLKDEKTTVVKKSVESGNIATKSNFDGWGFSKIRDWAWNGAWNEGKAGTFFVILLAMIGLLIIPSCIDSLIGAVVFGEEGSFSFFSTIVSLILSVGVIAFCIDYSNGIDSKFSNFWKGMTWNRIWKTIVFTLIIFVIIVIPVLLFILIEAYLSHALALILSLILCCAIFYFAIRFSFVKYVIVDKNLGLMDSIKYGWNITKGYFWNIVCFDLYFFLFNIIGFLCLIIGLLWTGTMTSFAKTRYYHLLSAKYENN